MPVVTFDGTDLECESGANLRTVLLEAGTTPHNGLSQYANCRGLSTCGTCAVEIEGEGAGGELTSGERRRLSIPPHDLESGLRLACQVRVEDDMTVRKYDGFWGQHVE